MPSSLNFIESCTPLRISNNYKAYLHAKKRKEEKSADKERVEKERREGEKEAQR